MKKIIKKIVFCALTTSLIVSTCVSANAYDFSYWDVNPKNITIDKQGIILEKINLDVSTARIDNQDYLYDTVRNIKVVKAETDYSTLDKKLCIDTNITPVNPTSIEYNQYAISGLYNMGRTFNIFKNLGYTPNARYGQTKTIYLAIHSNGSLTDNTNACYLEDMSSEGSETIVFGYGDDNQHCQAYDTDIVTHEYMHMITCQKFAWNWTARSQEIKALTEAYGDIMAELTAYNPDWKFAVNSYRNNNDKIKCQRNLINPEDSNAENKGYSSWNVLKNEAYQAGYANPCDFCSPGKSSTIISHAAYLMYENGLSIDALKHIWFDSINYLPYENATFSTCRTAVTQAARQYYMNNYGRYYMWYYSRAINKINAAFDAVGVMPS